jgi:ribose transport system permease protein
MNSEAIVDPSADTGSRPPSEQRRHAASSRGSAMHELGRFGLLILLVIVIVTFSAWKPDTFFAWPNFQGTFEQQAIILMVAFAAMLTLVVGEFDLTVGANAGLASIFAVGLGEKQHLSPWLALVVAVLIAAAIGLANGMIITRLGVNSFITTLGMGTLLSGIGQLYTGGLDINSAPAGLISIGRAHLFGVSLPVVVAIVTAVVLMVVMQKLPVGRELLAVGANRRAAELTGIRPDRKVVLAFTLAGAVAGVGGGFYGASLGSAGLATGSTLLLPSFAAVFLGATVITPGRYNVLGTIIAVLLLAFTISGLEQVGVDPWAQYVVQGGALIAAVALSSWAIRLRIARLRDAQLQSLTQRAEGETKTPTAVA